MCKIVNKHFNYLIDLYTRYIIQITCTTCREGYIKWYKEITSPEK